MVALLDAALIGFIEHHKFVVLKKYGNSLKGRIEYLNHKSALAGYDDLDRIRDFRNDLAHEIGVNAEWTRFDGDLAIVEMELQHLGFVGPRPDYKFFADRSAVKAGDQPGVDQSRDYRVGLKCGDEMVAQFGWTERSYHSNVE